MGWVKNYKHETFKVVPDLLLDHENCVIAEMFT
jgi:hypothetical protein